jgi:hypothetical protein
VDHHRRSRARFCNYGRRESRARRDGQNVYGRQAAAADDWLFEIVEAAAAAATAAAAAAAASGVYAIALRATIDVQLSSNIVKKHCKATL